VHRGGGVADGDRVPGVEQLGTPGNRIVGVGGGGGIGVPVKAVASVGTPPADDVHGQDRVRRFEDVGPYRLANIPAVGGGEGDVVERLLPLCDPVMGIARARADGAGGEAPDVGEDGGDFTSVQKAAYSVPVGSSRAASSAAMGAVIAAMPLIVRELDAADGQRLIHIKGLNPGSKQRFDLIDPAKEPPRYWPR
jgi:hypothetical protein